MAILNNLYPGVVDTYMPAFLIDSANASNNICRVYFSFSVYNSMNDISAEAPIQVIISNQYTNLSVLDEKLYPCGIMITKVYIDKERDSDDKYYFEIKPSDLKEGKFNVNEYYKVQFRLTGAGAESPSGYMKTIEDSDYAGKQAQAIEVWLTSNLSYFSEWSTVCLVRGISTPILTLRKFSETPDKDYTIWGSGEVEVSGKLTFLNEAETETLKSYRIKLWNSHEDLVLDTGDIYMSSYQSTNEISYNVKKLFQDGEIYHIEVSYITRNLYESAVEYDLMVVEAAASRLNVTLTPILDDDNGRIGIHIKNRTVDRFTGTIIFRRTSSESNYTIWEDVYKTSIQNEYLDFTWWDYSVKSGVWYRYCVQKIDSAGNRGVVTKLKGEHMLTLEDMFLTADHTQVKVRFDPNVSSFQYTVAENKVDTIGGKYPFIKRNGYTYYRQFPISGTISCFMDEAHIFTSRDEIYGDNLSLYDEYNDKKRINPWNDSNYEREFRDLVIDFLYKHNVKLFRSTPVGNVLVKLMNITFTPEAVLGGHIYHFSCTAYEVDEFNLDNLDYYGIQSLTGNVLPVIAWEEEYTGQVKQVIPAGVDVLTILQEYYQKYDKYYYTTDIQYLDFLRIEMEQPPYLIKEGNDGAYPIIDSGSDRDNRPAEDSYLGYIVNINHENIVINPEGIYELKNADVRVTSIIFPVDTAVNIDYHCRVYYREDSSKLASTIDYVRKNGQNWGVFTPAQSVYEKIWKHFYESYPEYEQYLISIDGLRVTANPGTVVWVREAGEGHFARHIINETHSLDFWDENSVIDGLYFTGIHFEPATEYESYRENMPDTKYVDTGITIVDINNIEKPIRNGVYKILNPPQEEADKIGELAMIQGKVVVLIKSDNILITEPDYDYELMLKNHYNYHVVIIGSEEEKNLHYKLKDDDDNLRAIYNETRYKQIDEEFASTLESIDTYIWYNDHWYPFTKDEDLLLPVEAVIDYECSIAKGNFDLTNK